MKYDLMTENKLMMGVLHQTNMASQQLKKYEEEINFEYLLP
jgi:hypothetical protein